MGFRIQRSWRHLKLLISLVEVHGALELLDGFAMSDDDGGGHGIENYSSFYL